MSNRTISDTDTPDPWMVAANGQFYLTFTAGNRIEIWASRSMENFRQCQKSVVWKPAAGTPWSEDIWAPELHDFHGTWYIYSCAAQPGQGNPSHRTIVLRSNRSDPMDASGWMFLGPLQGMPDGQWSIDATVFSPRPDELYCCYSGWPINDHSDTQQDLFLIRLLKPDIADPSSLVCISRAELPWERLEGGRRGVNEGPTWLSMPGFRGIVYSANGSWTCDYKLGVLQLHGDDAGDVRNWQKRPQPLLTADTQRGPPFGPGHASFVHSPYGDGRVYCVYHGTEKSDEGWNNRKARIINMGPEHFHSQAGTMCCAMGGIIPGPVSGPLQNQSGQPGYPGTGGGGGGGSGQVYPRPSHTSQHGGMLEKVGNKLLKKLKEF